MKRANILEAETIVGRMVDYSDILFRRCATRGQSLLGVWESFHDPLNPLRELDLQPSNGAPVLNLLANAALYEMIMIVVRSLDEVGKGTVFSSPRISFPVLLQLARQPGVVEAIRRRARDRHDEDTADWHADRALEAMAQIKQRVETIRKERPNRLARLRHFRNEFLAHNLVQGAVADPLVHGDTEAMLIEMASLSSLAEFALNGVSLDSTFFRHHLTDQAAELWRVIRRGAVA